MSHLLLPSLGPHVCSLSLHLYSCLVNMLINSLSQLSLSFILQLINSCYESCSGVSGSLRPHGQYSLWNSPGENTGVGSLSVLQGIFPTQGSNPGLPALHADSLPAEPPGKPSYLLSSYIFCLLSQQGCSLDDVLSLSASC